MLITLRPNYGTEHFYLTNKRKGNYIVIRHTHIAILNFRLEDNEDFLQTLSVWDPVYFKSDLRGGYFLEEDEEFRLPKGYPVDKLKEFFPKYKIYFDYKHFEYDEIDAKLFAGPKDDIQKICLAHMNCLKPYEHISKYTCQVIDMDTGGGKTYTAVATTVQSRGKSVIFIPITTLIPQWIEAFESFTSIKSSDIAVLKGSKMMEKFESGKFDDKLVYVISMDTFANYIKNKGDLATILLLQKTRAKNLFIDEVHKEMDTVMKIFALANFKMTYLMTSSFGRANKFEARIYKECFRFIPRIGKELKHDIEKHIQINIGFYRYTLSQEEHRFAWRPRIGLNGKSYETKILNGEGKKKLIPVFHKAYLFCKQYHEAGGKFLILSATINGAETMAKLMKVLEPAAKVGIYHSKINKQERANYADNDIICSTVDSLSTGADIANLQFCINIATYSNLIWTDQIAGRLRLNAYKNLIYIELVNKGYKQTYSQYNARLPGLCKKAASGKIGEF